MRPEAMIFLSVLLFSCCDREVSVPEHFKTVDQVIWVVGDLDNVIENWERLGFSQLFLLDTIKAAEGLSGKSQMVRMAKANLGGARITWIQPLEESSLFAKFHSGYGDGAMSLVHRLEDREALAGEVQRLSSLGVEVLEEVSFATDKGNLEYVFMDTGDRGKYILGYTSGAEDPFFSNLGEENLHGMKINQYAFAIREYEPVSRFWSSLGQPAFQINHPELGNMHYYGQPADHELIQGWQRHGSVSYEWCIPVKPPIVYDDHIRNHGEGIQHLAFSVDDMDRVLGDYRSKGFVNSMGGTWGEAGKPGSGRYEYIDMEEAGGLTVELLWSFPEQ